MNLSWAQSDALPFQTYTVEHDFISGDKLGNIFAVKDYKISSYSSTEGPLKVYERTEFGKISLVDATNPFEIVVFHQDLMHITILDKTLSELSELDLESLGFNNVTALGSSRDNNLWVYDNDLNQLFKIDRSGNILNQSEPSNLMDQEILTPNLIIEYLGDVYINDPEYGIYIYDNFGTLKEKINLLGIAYMQVSNGAILYTDKGEAKSYDLEKKASISMTISKNAKQVIAQRYYHVIADGKKIYLFKN